VRLTTVILTRSGDHVYSGSSSLKDLNTQTHVVDGTHANLLIHSTEQRETKAEQKPIETSKTAISSDLKVSTSGSELIHPVNLSSVFLRISL